MSKSLIFVSSMVASMANVSGTEFAENGKSVDPEQDTSSMVQVATAVHARQPSGPHGIPQNIDAYTVANALAGFADEVEDRFDGVEEAIDVMIPHVHNYASNTLCNPKYFPYYSFKSKICYNNFDYAAVGSGPCGSWCSRDGVHG